MKKILIIPILLIITSCYNVKRECKDFKIGKFVSEITVDGIKKSTTSMRNDKIVVETYEGKTDTATIRWINDCEYVLQKVNPKNMAEKKAINIKILTTTEKSYTFEFGIVGSDQKLKGTATRIN